MTTRAVWMILAVALLAGLALGGLADQRDVAEIAAVLELGDVKFPHELHYGAMELECEQCHHETEAQPLDVPHQEYFPDFWVKCATCHGETTTATEPLSCSHCHHESPADVADETLSAKVVLHRACWQCHEVSTGAEASRSCSTCHSGKRRATNDDVKERSK